MDELQKIFDEELDKFISTITDEFLKKSIKDKFLEQGVTLPDEKILEIVNQIAEANTEKIEIDLDDSIATKDLDLEITDLEVEDFKNKTSALISDLHKKTVKDSSEQVFKELINKVPEGTKLLRSDLSEFKERLYLRWKKAFDLLEFYLSLIYEAGLTANTEYWENGSENPDIVYEILLNLHARAVQIGQEVFALIKEGFADGAHARWRSLHEVSVVAQFIEKHGKDVAERYYDHEHVEEYKAANQYQTYAKTLKQQQISKREMKRIEKSYEDVLSKYGKDFRGQYGWAAEALKNPKATFADIEKDVGLEQWRPYYKMASHNVHANPKGITFRLGLPSKRLKILLAGRTDTGFTDPAHGTAISLMQITSTISPKEPNIDSLVLLMVLQKFEKIIGREFLKVQKRIEIKYYE